MFCRIHAVSVVASAFLIATLGRALPTPCGQGANFPEVVQKRSMYATHDLRGKPAPEIVAQQWLRALPSTKGKVVVLQFFLPWSGGSRRAVKTLNEWQAEFKDDLVVVGLTKESEGDTRKFVQLTKPQFAIGIDEAAKNEKEFGVIGHPFIAVVSPDGIVRWQGWADDREDVLDLAKIRQIVLASKARK